MVGDWPERDLDGAKSVGIKTAFAKYGALNINEKQNYNSDVILTSIDEILEYIKLENSKWFTSEMILLKYLGYHIWSIDMVKDF